MRAEFAMSRKSSRSVDSGVLFRYSHFILENHFSIDNTAFYKRINREFLVMMKHFLHKKLHSKLYNIIKSLLHRLEQFISVFSKWSL